MLLTVIFALVILLLAVPFRKTGWYVSKNILYPSSFSIITIISILWGFLVAIIVYLLILWLNPEIIVKIIFGYGFGAYWSVPDFGLFDENTMPDLTMAKHNLMMIVPLIFFAASLIIFGLLN